MASEIQKKRRKRILLVLSLYALVLLTVALPLTLSRYLTSGEGGDSAEVAQFDVSQSGTLTQTLEVEFGAVWTKSFDIVLENNGEVDVAYTVAVVRDTENLPLTFTWDGDVDGATLKSGEDITRTLTVTWSGTHDYQYSGEIDRVHVTVICEQVD